MFKRIRIGCTYIYFLLSPPPPPQKKKKRKRKNLHELCYFISLGAHNPPKQIVNREGKMI